MTKESASLTNTETQKFPIIEDEEVYRYDRTPDLREGKIIHFRKMVAVGETKHRFLLQKTILGLNFVFLMSETSYGPGVYQLSFKTEQYEFATVNLNPEAIAELTSAISSFIQKIGQYSRDIEEIKISPAGASYSKEEIEKCIEEILKSPQNTFTREQLMDEYKGFRVFDLYQEIFGKNFLPEHYTQKSRAAARSRLFKMLAKRHLPDWDVVEEYTVGNDFILVRKN